MLEPVELRNARYAMFGQSLVDLIAVLLELMRYPEDVDRLSEDEVPNLFYAGILVFRSATATISSELYSSTGITSRLQ